MPGANSLIPKITDADIEWVCSVMGLDGFDEPRRAFLKRGTTVDVSACPGSGKTTLLVAKLAILARRWPHRTKGICVLSHTNVARQQIEHRLGNTVIGQRLQNYPNFIDTIHSFVNRFLALPWLYSNGYKSLTVSDNLTTAYRRGVLSTYQYQKVQSFLNRKHKNFDEIRICSRDMSFNVAGSPFPSGESTSTFQNARKAVKTTAKAGYFCYDEMFVWAEALLEDFEEIPNWLSHRFPLFIIDEMQDTSERQASFLNKIFPRNSDAVVVQRVGDPNQKIFDLPDSDTKTDDSFPDPNSCLGIPNSYRFGSGIASHASPFIVDPTGYDRLSGIGPKGQVHKTEIEEGKHAIFIFPDKNTDGVLEAYGKHVLFAMGDEFAAKGPIVAVGHIHHQHDSDLSPSHKHYPKSVGHYWDGYNAEIYQKDPHPDTLIQYIFAAQEIAAESGVLSQAVEKIAFGLLELARRLGNIGDMKKRKTRIHLAILESLEPYTELLDAYHRMLKIFLLDKVSLSKDKWSCYTEDLCAIASALCDDGEDTPDIEKFLKWSWFSKDSSSNNPKPNIYRVTDGTKYVDIRVGSIHSVKGQTHLATLLLSTYWYDHSAKQIMPWLLGDKVNKDGAGNRAIQRLLHTYVAMTRPSHLLCLAVPRSALGNDDNMVDKNINSLKSRGWQVAEIKDGVAQWRN